MMRYLKKEETDQAAGAGVQRVCLEHDNPGYVCVGHDRSGGWIMELRSKSIDHTVYFNAQGEVIRRAGPYYN